VALLASQDLLTLASGAIRRRDRPAKPAAGARAGKGVRCLVAAVGARSGAGPVAFHSFAGSKSFHEAGQGGRARHWVDIGSGAV
jgi:hypothetical protein